MWNWQTRDAQNQFNGEWVVKTNLDSTVLVTYANGLTFMGQDNIVDPNAT